MKFSRILVLVLSIATALAVVGGSSAYADSLKKGDKEFLFAFDYSDIKFDEGGGDIKTTILSGNFGYLITNGNEVGGLINYQKAEVTGEATSDATIFGVFYNYNFKAGTNMNPYVGVSYATIGGNYGDVFKDDIGARVGIKVYPWSNGGFNFGLGYDKLKGESSNGVPDAKTTSAFAGINLKF